MSFADLIILLELALLFAISAVDLKERRIPNKLLALVTALATTVSLIFHQPPPLSALLGGCIGLVAFLLLARARPGALGMGDVKLAGAIGLMVGFPQVCFVLLLGMIAAGSVALALSLSRRNVRMMAYAPYLAIGAALVLLRG